MSLSQQFYIACSLEQGVSKGRFQNGFSPRAAFNLAKARQKTTPFLSPH